MSKSPIWVEKNFVSDPRFSNSLESWSTVKARGRPPATRQALSELPAKGDVQDITNNSPSGGVSIAIPLELSVTTVSVLEAVILHLDGIVPPSNSHTQDTVGEQTPTTHTSVQQVAPGLQIPPPASGEVRNFDKGAQEYFQAYMPMPLPPAPVLAPQPVAAVQQIVNPVGGSRVSFTKEFKAFLSFRPPELMLLQLL
ncbi:hypothetical protein HAX54_011364 [Datura stramonium]|uniref:Uncharacterized protein n=1 Tax=Datura stramonium TaxID=4076 RepID=A0ABS8THV2_DATST|nr:hypothetical protein [Datura stramonium]